MRYDFSPLYRSTIGFDRASAPIPRMPERETEDDADLPGRFLGACVGKPESRTVIVYPYDACGAWAVELIDYDSDEHCEKAVFFGANAGRRAWEAAARDYAIQRNGGLQTEALWAATDRLA